MSEPITNEVIERIKARLSAKALSIVMKMERADEESIKKIIQHMDAALSVEERKDIMSLMKAKARAHEQKMHEHLEGQENAELALSVFERAFELLGERPSEGMTLSEAVAVLERHGEELPDGLDLYAVMEVPK